MTLQGAGSKPVAVGLVQMAVSASPDENVARAEGFIREAAAQGAQLIVLPELFRSRYFCQVEDAANFELAEPVPGPTTERLERVAAELDVTIVASLFERHPTSDADEARCRVDIDPRAHVDAEHGFADDADAVVAADAVDQEFHRGVPIRRGRCRSRTSSHPATP